MLDVAGGTRMALTALLRSVYFFYKKNLDLCYVWNLPIFANCYVLSSLPITPTQRWWRESDARGRPRSAARGNWRHTCLAHVSGEEPPHIISGGRRRQRWILLIRCKELHRQTMVTPQPLLNLIRFHQNCTWILAKGSRVRDYICLTTCMARDVGRVSTWVWVEFGG